MINTTVEQLVETAESLGCTVTQQSSFLKIEAPTRNRKAIYVGKSKRRVARIDFAGFEMDSPILRQISEQDAKDLNLGAVRAQLLTRNLSEDVSDDQVMEVFLVGLQVLLDAAEGFKAGLKAATEDETETSSEVSEEIGQLEELTA